MKDVTVLVSASGAPGTAALLKGLRANGERKVRLVGTDMSVRSVGRHLCDAFHLVPAGSDPGFPDAVLAIVEQEGVDVVLPQSSFDLEGLAAHRDRFPVPVLVSSPDTIHRSNDKAETYAMLQRLGVKGPDFRRVNGAAEVAAAAAELGYPDRPVCFKPVFSSGSRGFRILDPTVDRAHQLLNERPGSVAMRLEEAVELLPDEGGPDLLVMELATGGERTIDGIADGEQVVLGHPKTREAMRAGLAMYFVTLEDEELMATADKLVEELAIEWFFNIQLVGEHVIEINPRISTIVYQDDLNLPTSASSARSARSPTTSSPGCARGSSRAGRACATSTRSTSTARSSTPARTRVAERPLRVTLCPVNTAGVPWTNAEALRRRGVDARLVVFERYALHPEADWSLDAPSNSLLLARQAKQWAAFARLLPRTDVFHFHFGLTLVPKTAPVPASSARRGRSRSCTTSAPTSAARHPSSSPTASGPTRRSSAATTRSAGCPRPR